jgi:hypothetical protein
MKRISEADRLIQKQGMPETSRFEAAMGGILDMVTEAQVALDAINRELDLPASRFNENVMLSKAIDLRNKARGILTLAEIIKAEKPRRNASAQG